MCPVDHGHMLCLFYYAQSTTVQQYLGSMLIGQSGIDKPVVDMSSAHHIWDTMTSDQNIYLKYYRIA